MNYTDKAKNLLEELMSPIPFFVRPMARKPIEKQILEVAQQNGHTSVEEDDVVRGYIIAGANRGTDKEKIKEVLTAQGYDLTKFEDILA